MSFTSTPQAYRPHGRVVLHTANSPGGTRTSPIKAIFEPTNIITIHTQKKLVDAAGVWEITFTYANDGKESTGPAFSEYHDTAKGARWDEIVRPMDFVEIYMGRAHDTADGAHMGQPLEIVMRGFVDSVRTYEGGGGHPQPQVIVSGRDYGGKMWLICMMQVLSPLFVDPIEIANWYGIDINAPGGGLVDLSSFFQQVIDKIIGLFVAYHQKRLLNLPSYAFDTSGIDNDKDWIALSPVFNPQALLQDVYHMIQQFGHPPWVEFFSQDYLENSTYVLRWTFYRGPLNEAVTPVDTPHVFADRPPQYLNRVDDWFEFTPGLADHDVFNWFYTTHAMSAANQTSTVEVQPPDNPYVAKDSIDIYGFKRFTPQFIFLPTGRGETQDIRVPAEMSFIEEARRFNLWNARMLGHNELLTTGSVRTRGKTRYRIGEYLQVDSYFQFYIEGVQQTFTWGQSWMTDLAVTRGMPIDRAGTVGFGVDYKTLTPYGRPATIPVGSIYEPSGDPVFASFGTPNATPIP